ncbi:MAG: NRDE family protein [Acidobacteria bacterium]|nr:NRDE family protein [Acidobacteriota bacterium]
MCTVTWHLTSAGYQLFFNRDELRTRATAQPPTLAVRGTVRYLAPTDTAAGGTWLAVNELGTAVGLLNSHPPEPGRSHEVVSRGHLVRKLASLRHAAQLADELAAVDLQRLEPFTLFALSPAAAPVIFEWDGIDLTPAPPTDTAMLASSSVGPVGSVDFAAVRRQLLTDYLVCSDDPARAHFEFHHSHRPERGELSPCMHRADAGTVSFSHVEVEESFVRFTYNSGPPCRESRPLGTELQLVPEPAIDGRPALSGTPVE